MRRPSLFRRTEKAKDSAASLPSKIAAPLLSMALSAAALWVPVGCETAAVPEAGVEVADRANPLNLGPRVNPFNLSPTGGAPSRRARDAQ